MALIPQGSQPLAGGRRKAAHHRNAAKLTRAPRQGCQQRSHEIGAGIPAGMLVFLTDCIRWAKLRFDHRLMVAIPIGIVFKTTTKPCFETPSSTLKKFLHFSLLFLLSLRQKNLPFFCASCDSLWFPLLSLAHASGFNSFLSPSLTLRAYKKSAPLRVAAKRAFSSLLSPCRSVKILIISPISVPF